MAGDWLRAADPLFSRESGLSERLIIAEFPSMERVWLNQEIGSIFARVLEMPLIRHGNSISYSGHVYIPPRVV